MVINEISDWIKYLLSVIPGRTGMYLRILYVSISMKKLVKVSISHGTILNGLKNIKFGTNVNFGHNSFISATQGSIKIGDNFFANNNIHLNGDLGGDIIIGNDVLIGPNVVFRSSNHNWNLKEVPIREQGNKIGDIIIENDVWIGANCVILPNVRIGEGAVIAAGSIVNKNIKPFSLYGGVPAKFIKKR